MATVTSEQILEEARKLTEKRMHSVKKIADAISARVEAEETLRKAQLAEKKAFTDAEKNGWTKAELNKLRPAKRRRSATTGTPSDAQSSDSANSTTDHG
ncbi:hypothetical protein E7744_15595 (plasmid) [Citricoccus sp. SGAir0253]|uniref:hypothetical protein n=1 Tax=Citricoccus sp. SGAir0253 TaxID=2567881 RepID=UPI0010CD3749|nr:hypothetical protein [Citricoccus sp. SGAir0253]QCU79730.1 hypothetical protein E7744_15595 [Citricoccus sp. SGAir0253]